MLNQLDHIVIGAATLDEGVAWCETTLGLTPGPGGEHLHMGTHNRLLRIGSPAFPCAYLEIIAIAPALQAPTSQPRWFDLDNPHITASLQHHGPQLLHWVANTTHIDQTCAAVQLAGCDLGTPQAVSRMTPRGLLEWTFSISATGQRPMGGALPHLIQWTKASPVELMPASAVSLSQVTIAAPASHMPQLLACAQALAVPNLQVQPQTETHIGNTPLSVTLDTPKGEVVLRAIP